MVILIDMTTYVRQRCKNTWEIGNRKRCRPKRGWKDDLIDYIQPSFDNLLEISWR